MSDIFPDVIERYNVLKPFTNDSDLIVSDIYSNTFWHAIYRIAIVSEWLTLSQSSQADTARWAVFIEPLQYYVCCKVESSTTGMIASFHTSFRTPIRLLNRRTGKLINSTVIWFHRRSCRRKISRRGSSSNFNSRLLPSTILQDW